MPTKIIISKNFERKAKKFVKKYASLKSEIRESFRMSLAFEVWVNLERWSTRLLPLPDEELLFAANDFSPCEIGVAMAKLSTEVEKRASFKEESNFLFSVV